MSRNLSESKGKPTGDDAQINIQHYFYKVAACCRFPSYKWRFSGDKLPFLSSGYRTEIIVSVCYVVQLNTYSNADKNQSSLDGSVFEYISMSYHRRSVSNSNPFVFTATREIPPSIFRFKEMTVQIWTITRSGPLTAP